MNATAFSSSNERGRGGVKFGTGQREPVALKSTEILFIVGFPRSGTTLTSMLCNGHSMLSIPPETHYFDKFRPKAERRGFRRSTPAFDEFVRFFYDSEEVAAFGFSESQLQDLRRMVSMADERSHRAVLWPLLFSYARAHGKTVPGEKTPVHARYVDVIAKEFPNARVLHVTRDPRDIVLSLRKVSWQRGNLVQHVREWAHGVREMERHRELLGDRYAVIRYEDLLLDPTAVATAICEFIGVPFEEGMLAYHERAVPNFNVEAEPWKRKNLQRIDSGNAGKWRLGMCSGEQAIIDRLAGPELQALGYSLSRANMGPRVAVRRMFLEMENIVLMGHHYWTRLRARLDSEY